MGEKETAAEEAQLVKPKTKSNQSNDRMDMEDADEAGTAMEGRKAGSTRDADQGFRSSAAGDASPEAAINNTKSNIKNLAGTSGDDDAGTLELAVSDEGVPADKPRPKSS